MATVNEKMTAIADAIRDKTGGTDALTLDDMVTAIPKVYDVGRQAEHDGFWDNYQENGNRTDYYAAFYGQGWNETTFKPRHDIKPQSAYLLFRNSMISGDLVELMERLGIVLDFSNTTNMTYVFANTQFTRVGVIDTTATISDATIRYMLYQSQKLVTVDKLKLKDDGTQLLQDGFTACSALENIVIDGVIGGSLDIHWSTKLTHDSLMSIINALKDLSGSGTSRVLTLGTTNLAKLTDSEKAIATQKGWTLA